MKPKQTRRLRAALAALSLILLLSACSQTDKNEVIVAKVGDHELSLAYFERSMNSFAPREAPVDFLTREGRQQYLDTLIDDEVAAIRAEQLGMAADGTADQHARRATVISAARAMREDVIADALNPTEEEIRRYYENYLRVLIVNFMILDTYDQALQAKRRVQADEKWHVVANEMSVGDPGPTDNWVLEMKYGTVTDSVEEVAFSLPVGEISEPIESVYGYFLLRVNNQRIVRTLPPLAEIRQNILENVIAQKTNLLLIEWTNEMFEEYGVSINDDALQTLFDALPVDPVASESPGRELVQPLALSIADLDKVLLRYGDEEWTLRRYSDFYDELPTDLRPRRENFMGGIRYSLKQTAVRELVPVVARDRGYMDQGSIRDQQKKTRDLAMVKALFEEVVEGQVQVGPQEIEQYWRDHPEQFRLPERRSVLALLAATEEAALQARAQAQGGRDWSELVEEFCIEGALKSRQGEVGLVSKGADGPIETQAFVAEAVGDVSQPLKVGPDQWLIVKLTEIVAPVEKDLEESRPGIAQFLQRRKQEEFFDRRVAEWREELVIERNDEALMDAVYDPNPVARSAPPRANPTFLPSEG